MNSEFHTPVEWFIQVVYKMKGTHDKHNTNYFVHDLFDHSIISLLLGLLSNNIYVSVHSTILINFPMQLYSSSISNNITTLYIIIICHAE